MTEKETVDVFGWIADRSGCGTIRVMQPLDALAEAYGISTEYDGKLNIEGMMPKVLIGQRTVKDLPSRLWQTIRVQENRPKMVFELDDDLWNIDPSNTAAYQWFLHGYESSTRTYHDTQGNLSRNIPLADRVTCTTEALAELLRKYNDDVHIVPNYIPRWLTEHERERRDRLTVGWVGSASHSMDWEYTGGQIKRFITRNPEIEFKVVGAEFGTRLKMPKDQVVETGWLASVEDCWRAIDFDIGIAPLRPHVFNRSKSAIKFLEYAALGVPTIASDVGPYADNVEHGVTGLLVKRDHEWGKYLRELANDEAMREEIGNNAREWAKTQILEDHIDEWKGVLCEW